jgi:hypothetical protein
VVSKPTLMTSASFPECLLVLRNGVILQFTVEGVLNPPAVSFADDFSHYSVNFHIIILP